MTVHAAGDGVSWLDLETLDVNQPHGLDYQQLNHLAKAIRKRAEHEHSAFADATVGLIHKPGACAVLGMEITDTAGDPTGLVVADGTYRGHGLVWSYKTDSTDEGVLWCATAVAGASTTGDWTILAMHPDRQWKGGDVTWAGAHAFQGNVDMSDVDITGSLDVSGDVAITGDFSVEGTADFGGDVAFVADVSIDVSLSVGGNANVVGDVSIDGTLAFQNAVLTGDSTFTFDPIAGETGPTVKIFGDYSARANDTKYTARTDGIVVAAGVGAGDLILYSPTATSRQAFTMGAGAGGAGTLPVPNGDAWIVTGATTVYWLPFGDNT